MADWPAYARVVADGYRRRRAETARRTKFEDGAARQAEAFTNAFTIREIEVLLESDADLAAFEDWAEGSAAQWFAWRDPEDGALRRVRVVGGAGGIDYRASVPHPGSRTWRARLALEGLRSDLA